MNAEKTYELTCSMLKAYDLHTGNAGAESVIRNPHAWESTTAPWLSIYSDAAKILIDCMENMEKKTTPAQAVAAVNRIVKEMERSNSRLAGIFSRSDDYGGYWLTNGYLLIRLNKDIASVKHLEEKDDEPGFDIRQHYKAMLDADNGDPVQLPTIAQLKAFQKAEAARGYRKARGYKDPRPVCLWDFWFCNPQLLIDILTIIPDAEAHKPESWRSPLYFHGTNGIAMLLPVHPRDDMRENAEIRAELKAA